MSLVMLEGFEGFGTTENSITNMVNGLNAKNSVGVNATGSSRVRTRAGWGGGISLDMNGDTNGSTVDLDVDASSTSLYIGFAYRGAFCLSETLQFAIFDTTGAAMMTLRQMPYSRRFEILRSTTIRLGITPPVIQLNDWIYVELYYFADNSTGAWELRVDGITVASDSGIDTQPGATATMNRIQLRAIQVFDTNPTRFDDVYVTTDQFLGPLKIQGLLPDSAGDDTDWIPSAGDNYACVDENPSTLSGTDYVQSGTTSNSDLYNYSSTTLATVYGVQVNTDAATSDSTDFDLINKVKSGTTEGAATAQAVTNDAGTYFTFWDIFEENPDTTSAWTASEINSMQAGIEVG